MSSSRPVAVTHCHDTLPSHIAVVFDSEFLLITNFLLWFQLTIFYNQLTIWVISSHPQTIFCPDPATIPSPHCILNSAAAKITVSFCLIIYFCSDFYLPLFIINWCHLQNLSPSPIAMTHCHLTSPLFLTVSFCW